ncbi:MAG: hypothetical protein ABJ059_18855, partial [Hyphomicrobiales bacterium]
LFGLFGASFPKFPELKNNWAYVSIYGGVLSLFVEKNLLKLKNRVCYISHVCERNQEDLQN